jgi:hypothetical protein
MISVNDVLEVFGVSETDFYAPKKNTNALNARGAYIYILREKEKMSFGNIAKAIRAESRGNIHTEYKKAVGLYESNTYNIRDKINEILAKMENTNPTPAEEPEIANQQEQNTFEIESQEATTPEPPSVEQSPLSEPVIERNIDTILRPKTKSETDFLDDLDDYQAFEASQDEEIPDTIPELGFKTQPNTKPDEVTIQMDDETADFSTDSILNMVEFGSVELACFYSQIPEREVREMEREGEVPPKSTEIAKEANDNARQKLEETASKKIKLLQEPLKKVLKKRNVSVSPESALAMAFVMFAFSMFMTAKSIRKDNDYFLEKLRKMNTEIKTEKQNV